MTRPRSSSPRASSPPRKDAPCTREAGRTVSTVCGSCSPSRSGERVAQVERPDRLWVIVGSVEEAAVDALVRRAGALVGPLHAELAMGQRLAGHLDAAEPLARPLGEQEAVEVDLRAEDLVHAAHEAAAGARVLVGVEELAAHLQAARGVDQLVAEGPALSALAGAAPLLLGLSGHGRSV